MILNNFWVFNMFRVHTVILYKRRKCDKVFSPKSRNVTCGPEAWQSNALTPKTKGRVMTGLMRDLSPSSLVVPPQLNTLPRAPCKGHKFWSQTIHSDTRSLDPAFKLEALQAS